MFTRTGGVWTQQGAKLLGTGNIGATTYLATSVSLSADGNTAIIGGTGDNSNVGAAWVFTRTGGVWSQQGNKLIGTGNTGIRMQGFGSAISADGNTAVVGGVGAIWVFTRTGGVWTQQGNKLVGTGNVGITGLNASLSADGNTMITSGTDDGTSSGTAWIFTRSAGVWKQAGSNLVGTGSIGTPQQGFSSAISADASTSIMGANADNAAVGASWVFIYTPAAITTTGTLTAFTTCAGTASASQSFTVSGINVLDSIIVTAPAGYEVSKDNSVYSSTVSLVQVGDSVATTTIYARLSASASGTPSGNITVAAAGATTKNVAASGTVNALPTITTGVIAGVSTFATSFSIPYSATTGSPNQYSLTTGTTAMSGFDPVINTTLPATPISITIPASSVNTYNFNITVKNTTTGCVSASVPLSLTVLPPAITTTGTLTIFNTCVGTGIPSTAQSFTVAGTNLTANITLTPPVGFEVSTSATFASSVGTNASPLVLTQSGGSIGTTTVYARLAGSATGTPSGNIACTSTGATTQNVAASGTVNALPTITDDVIVGVLTTATSFNIPYPGTTGSPNQFSLTTGARVMSGFSTITNASLTSSPLIIPIPASTPNTYDFNLTVRNSTTGCISVNHPLSLIVITPSITITGSLTAFSTCTGTASSAQNFFVQSFGLTANVSITPPVGFEISTSATFASSVGTNSTPLVITQIGGDVGLVKVYVRITSSASGTPSGNIACTSTGAVTQNVAASGTVNALPTITTGVIVGVLSTATSFSIPYSATTGSTNQYSLTTGATAMSGFDVVSNATLGTTPISVTIPASAANTYNFNLTVKNSTTGCVSANVPLVLSVTSATITATGTLSAVATVYGTASATTSFSVSGTNLLAGILVTAPAGFEVSTAADFSSNSGTSITVGTAGTIAATTVYARLAATTTVGSYSGNIVLTSTSATTVNVATVSSTVTAKALTITGMTANNKVYTGTTAASLTGTAALSGVLSADAGNVTVSGTPTATFASAGVANNIAVTVSGYTISGSAAGNYTVSQPTGLTANITPVALTITGMTASNKVYTGTTATSLTGTAALSGVLGIDAGNVTVSGTPTAVFASAGVGNNIAVTVSGYTISGSASGNYTVSQPGGLTANITPAPLTVTASNQTKTYGTAATLGSTAFTSTGLQNSETIGTVALASTGSVATAAVGTYPITISTAAGGTFTASNYTITYTSGTLTVNPVALTITATNQSKTYGVAATLGTTAFTSTGLQNGETIGTVTLASTGAVATAAAGTYSITISTAAGGTFTASNYTITYTSGTLTVNPAALTITARNQTKCQGASYTFTNADYTVTGLITGDAVTAVTLTSAGSGSAALATGSPYTIVPSAATGTGLSNYTITYTNGSFTITPPPTVTLSANPSVV